MTKRKIGAVTIGQSPRVDVTPELIPYLGANTEVLEVGALDHLSPAEIAELAPGPGDSVLVSRLRDGSQVRMSQSRLLPLVQRALDSLEGKVTAILLLCTGTFPAFRTSCPTLYPEHLLFHVVQGILGEGGHGEKPRLGVITPDAGQLPEQSERWAAVLGTAPLVVPCSPYQLDGLEERLTGAAAALKAGGAELVVLDCLGYGRAMKQVVAKETGLPVLLARTVLARVAAELLDDGSGMNQ